MYSEETKPYLITVHGIRTDGAWQESSEPLMRPFYRCRPFKYTEFLDDWSGPIWLALELIGMVLGFVLALAWIFFALRFGLANSYLRLALGIGIFLLFWLGAAVPAGRRMEKVINDFAEFWGKAVGYGLPPHVIAHSLGTYISGFSLRKFGGLRASTVILTGCVLQRKFGWSQLFQAGRVKEVRNEIARRDAATRAAYLLHGVMPQMGHAGVFGFVDPPHTFDWPDPHAVLAWCEAGCNCANPNRTGLGARVHNVIHAELGHNDYFIGPAHAIAFWLPALWDIPAKSFSRFRELCLECRREEVMGLDSLAAHERELRQTCWGWTDGPLESRVAFAIRKRLKTDTSDGRLGDLTSLAIRNLWCITALAAQNPDNERHAVNLYPRIALVSAIEDTLRAARLPEAS